jgi:hypothetical protein
MIGRFIGQDGKQRNLPTARFGKIARMNGEPIPDKFGINQDSLMVEMRSISGYSGSPVFVLINPLMPRPPLFHIPTGTRQVYYQHKHGPWLLGIDWSHIPNFKPVLEKDAKTRVTPTELVEVNSGMAGVIPAWRIKEILELPELVMDRKKTDEEISQRKQNQSVPVNDSAQSESFTQADFEAALKKASRKIEPKKN